MSRYKVTLTPLGWFFFGGEQTFDNGVTQSFIARSLRFPQQTTLLGMLRYQLLKQNNLLLSGNEEKDKTIASDMEALIGKDSFDIEANETQSFGKIKSISPVFIQIGGHQLVPMPLTNGLNISFDKGEVWLSGIKKETIIKVPSFNEKEYDNYCKMIDETGRPWDIDGKDGVFTSSMQIGITKADEGDENEKGFYKQETLRFKSRDASFTFYLELEDDTKLDRGFVFLGAQRSCFKMEVEESDEKLFVPDHPEGSILLLSPTYIYNQALLDANCLQHWSGTTSFRNLQQRAGGKLQSGAICYHRHSLQCTFLTAGTVIFYQDEKQLKKLKELLDVENLIIVGNNYYNVK